MKILHVNKFLYRRGGAEAYLFDLAEMQRRQGHVVRFFAMAHPENERSELESKVLPELQAILGFTEGAIYDPARPGEVQRIYLDASRAKRVLGWEPKVAFTEGLRRTVEWTRRNPLPTKR